MVEVFIVAVLVVWSALVVFKKVFPRSAYTVFSKLADVCTQQGWHALAKRVQPAIPNSCGGSCGCGDSSSGKKPKAAVEIQQVKWK